MRILALICLTAIQIKNIECNQFCRDEGFSRGKYESLNCLCNRAYDYEAATSKRFTLVNKPDGKLPQKEKEDDGW